MKAMILGAGRGERLRPLTDYTPKPLLMAGGKPLIEHLILSLVKQGFLELIINVAHCGEQIQSYLGDGQTWGARIEYSEEREALETGGGIFHALPKLGDAPFLVVNGDIATDFPFCRMQSHPKELAHLILVPNPPHHIEGDFGLEGEQVLERNGYTFSGIGVYRPELFADCILGRFPLAPLLRKAISQYKVSGELYSGFWMDIGTLERLQAFDYHLQHTMPSCK